MFVAINIALLIGSGVRVGGDSGIYVDGAEKMLSGRMLTARQPSYAGYIAVVAASQAVGVGLWGVVAVQLAAAIGAAVAVYGLALELGGRLAGGVAVLLFAADINTNRWHAYVLSDSLYASLLVIAVWLVYRAGAQTRSLRGEAHLQVRLKPYVVAALGLLAAASIRPEGWFLIPAAIAYWVARLDAPASRRAAMLAGGVLACAVLYAAVAPRLGGNLSAVGPAEMLRRGQTIWEYDGWRVAMPDDPALSSQSGNAAALEYGVRHPLATATLMAARLGVHAVHVRPYYSLSHNLMIAVWLAPFYLLTLIGAWATRRQALLWWCAIALASQSVVVALTHADWDGRYLGHVMPLLYPCAACGLLLVLQRVMPAWHARVAQ